MMTNICIQYHKTKIGELVLGSFEGKLCLLDFSYRKMRKAIDDRLKNGLNADFIEEDSDIIEKTRTERTECFQENRQEFDVPIQMIGTDFQKSVWNALLKVAYGTTSSYLQQAKYINNEKAVRAVAGANRANAIAIIIPCHRIIGSNGALVGYAGGLPTKEYLLKLEQRQEV